MDSDFSNRKPRMIGALIVDDTPQMRTTLENLLSSLEDVAPVVSVRNAVEALLCFDHLRPDLVLTDYQMPGINGLQLARALRMRAPRVKVIITSIDELQDLELKPESLDDCTFISKRMLPRKLPCEIQRLLRTIQTGRE